MTTGDELEDGCCPFGFMLLGDICTTSAGSADEASVLPALTAAMFAPLAIAKVPDETEVIVGFDDRITVGLDDRITVGFDDRMTVAFDDGVNVRTELFGESVTTSALIDEVAALASPVIATVTGAEVLPFEIGEPTAINWLMVATVPVPLDGMPDVTPTEVRSAIS